MPLLAGNPVFGEYQTMPSRRSRIISPGVPGPARGYPDGVRMKYGGSEADVLVRP